MNEIDMRQQLRDCAEAAAAAWPQLIAQWSWAEINQHDAVRRLLTWAVAWARDVGENGVAVDVRVAKRLIAEIEQLSWPSEAESLQLSIRHCATLALALAPLQPPPTLNELDLHRISDSMRILLTVRAAERAILLLPKRGISAAHRVALRAALDWARAIGEGRLQLTDAAERPFTQAIDALHWPGRSAHVAGGVASCLATAGNPWVWEMSQARYQHLVASVDLQRAVRAGVKEADIGRDYLELQRPDPGSST
jgi:hypothetical protein